MRPIFSLLHWFTLTALLLMGSAIFPIGWLLDLVPNMDLMELGHVHHINGITKGVPLRAKVLGAILLIIGVAWLIRWRLILKMWHGVADDLIPLLASYKDKRNKFIQHETPWHKGAVVLLFGIGVVMRVLHMNVPITYDEAFSLTHFVQQPIQVVLADYSFPNNHVFHTILMKGSYWMFGSGLWAIRLPAFIAGILLLPMAYSWVRTAFNKRVAIVTLAFLACSNTLIEYGTEARGYGIWMCFFVVSLWLVTVWLKSRNKAVLWLFAGANILALYTTPAAVYSQSFVGLYLLWELWKRHRSIKHLEFGRVVMMYVGIGTMVLMLYSLIIIYKGPAGMSYHPHMGHNSSNHFYGHLFDNLAYIWHYWNSNFFVPGMHWLMMGLFLLGVAVRKQLRVWVVSAFGIAGTLVFVQQLLGPARVWIYLYLLIVVGVSVGLVFLWDQLVKLDKGQGVLAKSGKVIVPLFAVLLCLLHASTYTGKLPFRHAVTFDFEETSLYLKSVIQPNDRILAEYPNDTPLEYYLVKNDIPLANFRDDFQPGAYLYVVIDPEGVQTVSTAFVEGRRDRTRVGDPELVHSIGTVNIYRCEVLF